MGIFWRPGHPKSGSRGAAEGAAGGISLTILSRVELFDLYAIGWLSEKNYDKEKKEEITIPLRYSKYHFGKKSRVRT